MKTGVLVYVRLDSARLNKKALQIINGRSLVSIVILRAKRVDSAQVIIASTNRDIDRPLQEIASLNGVPFFGGDPADLVDRTVGVIQNFSLDRVVRVNGDSPLVSPELINAGLSLMEPSCPFVTNLHPRSYPYGVAVEIFDTKLYLSMQRFAQLEQREHVTAHLYSNIDRINHKNIRNNIDLSGSQHLTIDTQQDLDLYRRVIEQGHLDPGTVHFADYLKKLEEIKA